MKKLQTTVTAAILATALAGSAFAAGTGTGAPSNSSSTNANSSATDSTNTGAVVPGSTDQNGNQVNGANSSTQPYPPANMAQPKTDSTGIAKGH